MQPAKCGDTIGLLLDVDAGTLTVHKNDERLGVMATGLEGRYCWAVSLGYGCAHIEPATDQVAQRQARRGGRRMNQKNFMMHCNETWR
jgi:hypothetical protein